MSLRWLQLLLLTLNIQVVFISVFWRIVAHNGLIPSQFGARLAHQYTSLALLVVW